MNEGGREGGRERQRIHTHPSQWQVAHIDERTSRQADQALVEIIDDVMRVHLFLRRPLPLAQRSPWDKRGPLGIAAGDDRVGNRTCQGLERKRRQRVPCRGGRRQGGVVRWWRRRGRVLLTGRSGAKAWGSGMFIHLAAVVALDLHITQPGKGHTPGLTSLLRRRRRLKLLRLLAADGMPGRAVDPARACD